MAGNKQQAPVSPAVTIPGYKITEVLGKGGMAIVYLAIQESIGRNVALKILAPDHTDDSFTDRFLREARIISQLAHPNIITIFDAGVHQGYHYMCMEYIPGRNLTQARDSLSRKQKIGIIKQIAQALDYAGKKGYVHRDIKPENIMLHEDGRAILTDFGIAHGQDVTRGLTQTGKAIGTPYFMSPEQTKGLPVDHRSDIYSLGVVLYQAVAGQVPFDGPSIVAIGIKHISEPVPPLPPGMEILQPIINKCMSKDPAHRYQRAAELHQALDSINEAQLDFIEAKAKAQRQVPANHQNKTQLEQPSIEILADSAARPAQANKAIPKMRAQRISTPIDITETDEFRQLSRRRRRWLWLLLLLSLGVAGYTQQDRLITFWHEQLQPRLAPYLPAASKVATKPDITAPPPATLSASTKPPETPDIGATKQGKQTPQEIAATVEHQDKLPINADDTDARKGTRAWFQNRLKQALADKDVDRARRILGTIRRRFPRLRRLPALAQVEQRIQRIERFNAHLAQARVYMAANAAAKPDGANALEEYQAASRIEPGDPAVRQGLQRIADYFYKKAKTAQAGNKLAEAADDVTTGLQAVADDTALLALKHQLDAAVLRQQQVKQMLQQADALMRQDQVLDPAEANAYQLFRQVLQLAPHNQAASNGLQQVQLWLLDRIHGLYDKQQYLPARKLVQRARRAFPDSNIFTPLQSKIEKAIDATYPRITRIVFSASPVTSLTGHDSLDTLAAGQTLYAGFSFKNFYTAKTELIARLKNSDGHTLYDERKVMVTGHTGQGRFALHLPQPGSRDGNYSVELYMNKTRILRARLTGLQ